jgi:phosphopantothenoylcysteine decarboxylase/phosphopantothenate--cysteine ligase
MLQGKRIVLGITGGIAAYKAAELTSRLTKRGAIVEVIMTRAAQEFITPLTLQTLARGPVYTDTFTELEPTRVSHIGLADNADLVLVAPATANMIGKMAGGIADDMLSTVLLATQAPVLVAPAMNGHMYAHPAVQQNMLTLRERGVVFIEPGEGLLACGYVGKGRLAEPRDIVAYLEQFVESSAHAGADTDVGDARGGAAQTTAWQGKRVVVTAGGTMERLDPVRYLTNDSSGRMGFALALAAARRGAQVTVVAARTTAPEPAGVQIVRVESAEQMLAAVLQAAPEADVIIKAAAVADYRPRVVAKTKMKKQYVDGQATDLTLALERTPDILQTLGKRKQAGLLHALLVGFAAETEDLSAYAMDKLRRKGADLIVANDVTQLGAGFNGATNIVDIYGAEGLIRSLARATKQEIAEQILNVIDQRIEASEQ